MKFSKTFFIALLLTGFFSFNIVRAETGVEIDAINEQVVSLFKTINKEVVSLYKAGKYDEALKLAKKSSRLAEKHYGPEHPETAKSIGNLATLYESQGDYATAKPLFQRVLNIYEKTLGKEHPDTAAVLATIASLYTSQGDYAAAKPLLQRVLSIYEKTLGREHPDTQLTKAVLLVLDSKIKK